MIARCQTSRTKTRHGQMLLVVLLVLPIAADADCVGMGCDAPVREAGMICCNTLVFDPTSPGVGASRNVDCSDYLRDHATPEARKSICATLRTAKKMCGTTAELCSTPGKYGDHCGSNPPENGALYARGRTPPGTRIHADPSSNSKVRVVVFPAGRKLFYTKKAIVNGQVWYYVRTRGLDGRSWVNGWVSAASVSCPRPYSPSPPVDPGGFARPTAAQAIGARG